MEMQLCAGAEEDGGSYGTVSSKNWSNPGRWLQDAARWFETSDRTDPGRWIAWCCDDFKSRRLKAPIVLVWLLFQVAGIVFQSVLLWEVTGHLWAYEETLTENCGSGHQQQGVCLGPSWNLSVSTSLRFPAQDSNAGFDFVIPPDTSFSFDTKSSPATFLVAVEPEPPHEKAQWKLVISSKDTNYHAAHYSNHDVTPMSGTGSRFRVITVRYRSGPRSWKGRLNLMSKFEEACTVHVYVVDSRISHLEDVHGQKQCSFEESWQNFNERHSGEHHRVLTNAQLATGFFLVVSVASTVMVAYRFFYYVEGGKLLSRVIAVKFVVQDWPQQMCIVAYLYGWYAKNGLRCQMCLFHPEHCDSQEPLHWTNLMVCFCTLLSSSSNQLIFQAKNRKYEDEEECCLWLFRAILISVSALPFCTAMFFLSSSMLHANSLLVYTLSGVPMVIGWFACCCAPMLSLCDDDGDGWDI